MRLLQTNRFLDSTYKHILHILNTTRQRWKIRREMLRFLFGIFVLRPQQVEQKKWRINSYYASAPHAPCQKRIRNARFRLFIRNTVSETCGIHPTRIRSSRLCLLRHDHPMTPGFIQHGVCSMNLRVNTMIKA